jgi:putative ATP-dependent endonuclease of the OLD family
MKIHAVKFRGFRCFKTHWAGFDELRSVNVIIGRNNVGKSHLLELVSSLCTENGRSSRWETEVIGRFDTTSLKQVFRDDTSGGNLGGNWWGDHGKKFVGCLYRAVFDRSGNISEFELRGKITLFEGLAVDAKGVARARDFHLREVVKSIQSPIGGKKFKHILPERDIQPEPEAKDLSLNSSGRGATNIIRRFLVSSSDSVSRDLIRKELLGGLNEVFGPDGNFTEITVRLHDEAVAGGAPHMTWEVFLGEEKKGLVSLSRSGSGLKTVMLVLLHLLVIPQIEHHTVNSYVYAFEELENNLHPALLRRLLKYIDQHATKSGAMVFLTTHSSAALDFFGPAPNAQIIHVTNDGESAKATSIAAHFDRVGIISELGAKPSDLLQSNGIVWVEGPSDRIYLNRWIELLSNGELREGKDYACAFYGGSLLARVQFASPETANEEFTNLLRINGNIAVICDSDKRNPNDATKDRVARIQGELKDIPNAYLWVTAAKEIENYLPKAALEKGFEGLSIAAPGQFEQFFPNESGDTSFAEAKLGRKSINKTELAELMAPHLTTENMEDRFDWRIQCDVLVQLIRNWNK